MRPSGSTTGEPETLSGTDGTWRTSRGRNIGTASSPRRGLLLDFNPIFNRERFAGPRIAILARRCDWWIVELGSPEGYLSRLPGEFGVRGCAQRMARGSSCGSITRESGATTLGRWLERQHGFLHLDVETQVPWRSTAFDRSGRLS